MKAEGTCRVCGNGAGDGASYVDAAGTRCCASCFQFLRRSESAAASPLFRCSICGQTLAPRHLQDFNARLVCRDCLIVEDPRPANASGDATAPPDAETASDAVLRLLKNPLPEHVLAALTCPHCWHMFLPEQLLWISEHGELRGDPILGPEAMLRFLPSRFNAAGEAIDLRDMPCQLLACPRCHLGVPRALAETAPLFLSIVGAPGSGKSHFIASMCWELRRVMPASFRTTFTDADAVSNRALNAYEEMLFLQSDMARPVAIRKTELHGELYDQIRLGQQVITLPRPFLFTLRPESTAAGEKLRLLCLYDNAGEHFHPGMDSISSPGTQHLARSNAILFLFDPTQHPRLRDACRPISDDPQLAAAARNQRQEIVLTEAAARVRRYAGLPSHEKHRSPLIVIVSKADIWAPLLKESLAHEPILPVGPEGRVAGIDRRRIEKISARLRTLLMTYTPEFVAAAEDFCQHVVYIPVSALGHGPSLEPDTGMLGIRPKDVKPQWVTVPILYALAKTAGELTSAAPKRRRIRADL